MKPTVAIRQGARSLPYGLVSGFEVELGCFSRTELEGVRGPFHLPIERDIYYQPQSLKDIQEYERGLKDR